MEHEFEESLEIPQEETITGELGSTRALVIGAFAAGVLAGSALTVGLLILGRVGMDRLNIGKPRPRRLLIGNLEIEERGDATRFRVD